MALFFWLVVSQVCDCALLHHRIRAGKILFYTAFTGKADDALKRFYFLGSTFGTPRRKPHRVRSEHVKNRSRLYGVYDLGENGMNISRELSVLAMPTLYQDAAARAQQPAHS